MMCLNTVGEVEKLQTLQNRCMRFSLDIGNPLELGVDRLHQITRVNMLDVRRKVQLLNLMHSLKLNNMYKKDGVRVTRSTDRYVFYTDIVHKDVYAKSPYFKGVALWNDLPIELQIKHSRHEFKLCIKRHLNIF